MAWVRVHHTMMSALPDRRSRSGIANSDVPVVDRVADQHDRHTFGSHQRRRDDLDLPGERSQAIAELTRWVNAWRRGIAALPVAEVMTVGLSNASDIDTAAPFGHLVLHKNRELIHHGPRSSCSRTCTPRRIIDSHGANGFGPATTWQLWHRSPHRRLSSVRPNSNHTNPIQSPAPCASCKVIAPSTPNSGRNALQSATAPA
jgi:hypothetical protein